MKKIAILGVACAALSLGACAGRASSVAPIAISASDYGGLSCSQARSELASARSRENALTRQQNNAALADAAGVFLFLLPLGSVFGADKEGELAQAKGEVGALERHIRSNCGG